MITLYSKPSCPYCDKAEEWFNLYTIPYQKVDVTQDRTALKKMKDAGHRTVPQIYHNDFLIVTGGYAGLTETNPEKLRAKLS